MTLRPAQADILQYRQGRLAISAVPGSGKTFTLALLAAELISNGAINVEAGQQILVVTYLNSSVENFRATIRQRLAAENRPATGFDVRTLHSLSLEIVRLANGGSAGDLVGPLVADELQTRQFLSLAVSGWLEDHPEGRSAILGDAPPPLETRWRDNLEQIARAFIRTAKNERWEAAAIQQALQQAGVTTGEPASAETMLVALLAGIYGRYQAILSRQGVLDFDDLVWQAANLLQDSPGLAEGLGQRWPYVLEDEAQDSIPLQERLLATLTGYHGNWVRVGDPNQAITSSFTAAHPRHFNDFLNQPDVLVQPLVDSGRCAPLIFEAANALVTWTLNEHPLPEVRAQAFRRQYISPTPAGDPQPNPPDAEATLDIKVFGNRQDDELPAIVIQAVEYVRRRPEYTLAILTPTNELGQRISGLLETRQVKYDSLLRGGGRVREVAAVFQALLGWISNPLDSRLLEQAYEAVSKAELPAVALSHVSDHFNAVLRSVHSPEIVLYPGHGQRLEEGLPPIPFSPDERLAIESFSDFLRSTVPLTALPADDLILALGELLFGRQRQEAMAEAAADLAITYQLAAQARQWRELELDWHLPLLVARLGELASGRRQLPDPAEAAAGFKPTPGRITLATQHGAKGLEWDVVFLAGMDGRWIPATLEGPFIGVSELFGGDLVAESVAQLRYLMEGDAGLYPGYSATDTAHIELICERLRLLYVGITRARRRLHISRSQTARWGNREESITATAAVGAIHDFLQLRATGPFGITIRP